MIEQRNIKNHQGDKLTKAVLVGKWYMHTNAKMQSHVLMYQKNLS